MTDKTAPLYVVCSPFRGVGKTLVARLLADFYVVNDRPVAAFDLADEGPQLADYLPVSFPKIPSGRIRALRQNRRIIRGDARYPSAAWDGGR